MEKSAIAERDWDTFTCNTNEKKARCWTKTIKQQHYSSKENSSDPPCSLKQRQGCHYSRILTTSYFACFISVSNKQQLGYLIIVLKEPVILVLYKCAPK